MNVYGLAEALANDAVGTFAETLRVIASKPPLYSGWLTIDQSMIDAFALVTRDANPLHVDPQAAAGGPFGATVAHGFLILSLLSSFVNEAVGLPGKAKASINRGFDRIRFMKPVPVNSQIRNRFKIVNIKSAGVYGIVVQSHNLVEILGEKRPALVADWEFLVRV